MRHTPLFCIREGRRGCLLLYLANASGFAALTFTAFTASASGSHSASLFCSTSTNHLDYLQHYLEQTKLMMKRHRKSQPPQQKAWTGPNPITQRPAPVVPNGTEKSTSRPTSQSLPKTTAETNGDKHAHDRALFLLASFTVRIPCGLLAASYYIHTSTPSSYCLYSMLPQQA